MEIRHGTIPTGKILYGHRFSESTHCNYCGELDDLTHILIHAVGFQNCLKSNS